jgi:hypothetical protein
MEALGDFFGLLNASTGVDLERAHRIARTSNTQIQIESL